MATFPSPRERAFNTLSAKAQLYVGLAEARTDGEKFLVALHYKAYSLIQFYLDSGINPNAAVGDIYPLNRAVGGGSPIALKLLLDKGATTHTPSRFDGTTLFETIFFDCAISIKLLNGRIDDSAGSRLKDLIIIAAQVRATGLSLDLPGSDGKTPSDTFRLIMDRGDREQVLADLLTKIEAADLSCVSTDGIVAESPESIQLTVQEQEQVTRYQNGLYNPEGNLAESIARLHAVVRRVPIRDLFLPMRVRPEIIDQPPVGAASLNPLPFLASAMAPVVSPNSPIVPPKEALNGTQKSIIAGYLSFIFETIEEQPSKADVVKAFQAILADQVSEKDKAFFQSRDLWDSIEQVRAIFSHPAPQNRSTSYPYFAAPHDINTVVFPTSEHRPGFEQRGLLSLSARNDATAPPVTKKAVVVHITQLIQEKIHALQEQAAHTIQRTFKHAKTAGLFSRKEEKHCSVDESHAAPSRAAIP